MRISVPDEPGLALQIMRDAYVLAGTLFSRVADQRSTRSSFIAPPVTSLLASIVENSTGVIVKMATGATIRVGDKTDHGGEVVEGFSFFQIDGRPAAGVGHAVTCPKCSGKHYIVGGVDSFTIGGIAVAIDGMKTSCGATLIASQSTHTLEHTSGPVGAATGTFAAENLPHHIASDEDLEQFFVFKHGDTGEPVQGMTYKLTSNGSGLVDAAQLTSGSTEACSLTNYPNLQLVAWRT